MPPHHRRRPGVDLQRSLEPAAALVEVTEGRPEAVGFRAQPLRRSIPPVQTPGEGRAQVVVVRLQTGEPPLLVGSGQFRLRLLGQGQAPGRVPAPHLVLLTGRRQPFEPVLSDRLQHPEPPLVVPTMVYPDETLVDERGEPFEDARGWGRAVFACPRP
jgi:hypothetical protein